MRAGPSISLGASAAARVVDSRALEAVRLDRGCGGPPSPGMCLRRRAGISARPPTSSGCPVGFDKLSLPSDFLPARSARPDSSRRCEASRVEFPVGGGEERRWAGLRRPQGAVGRELSEALYPGPSFRARPARRAPQRTPCKARGATVGPPLAAPKPSVFFPPFFGEAKKGGRPPGRNPGASSQGQQASKQASERASERAGTRASSHSQAVRTEGGKQPANHPSAIPSCSLDIQQPRDPRHQQRPT